MKLLGRLILLRHGHCESMQRVPELPCPEDADNHLTSTGRQAVARVARRLAGEGITHCVASPLPRSRETASIVAGVLDLEPVFDSRLEERRLRWPPGTTGHESRRFQLEAWRDPWREEWGESLAEHRARVADWLEATTQTFLGDPPSACLLSVSHGGTLHHLLALTCGIPLESGARGFFDCAPAHFHVLALYDTPNGLLWCVEATNCGVDMEPV